MGIELKEAVGMRRLERYWIGRVGFTGLGTEPDMSYASFMSYTIRIFIYTAIVYV